MSQVIGKVTQDLRTIYGNTPEKAQIFAFGFAAGQAEKVALGVCNAAMFRPGVDSVEWFREGITQITKQYKLEVSTFHIDTPETPIEFWIYPETYVIGRWLNYPINSPEWHKRRAEACGVPNYLVDTNYHLRNGYGENCD